MHPVNMMWCCVVYGTRRRYNDTKKHGQYLGNPSCHTLGGYAGSQTAHEHFVIKIPDGMDLAKTAPILCAGGTALASTQLLRVYRS